MTPLLEQLLLPQRLATRVLDDVHRIAAGAGSIAEFARDLRRLLDPLRGWMDTTATTLESLRDEASGIRAAVGPMSSDLDTLRVEFGRANDEIARLRESVTPEFSAFRASAERLEEEVRRTRELLDLLDGDVKDMGQRVSAEMHALQKTVASLVRDADDIAEVVEPLQAATERVGRVAERLPGGNRKR